MPHALIVGAAGSGKTTLATSICAEARKSHKLTAVCDPLANPKWRADFFSQNFDGFKHFLMTHKCVFAFIDESGAVLDRHDKGHEWVTTISRNYGHHVFLLCQGIKQLSPMTRGNCSNAYVFNTTYSALGMIAEDFNHPELLKFPRLGRGEFYKVSTFSEISKYSIDFRTGRVKLISAHM